MGTVGAFLFGALDFHESEALKKPKPPRPQDARRSLKKLWRSFKVYSCADGTLRIEPKWSRSFRNPGLFTRMHSAYLVESVIAANQDRVSNRTKDRR